MENENLQTRREFLKTSGKLVAGATFLGLGGGSLLAANSNGATSSAGGSVSAEAVVNAKAGERIPSKGYAAFSSEFKFKPYSFSRHPMGDNDILIEIMYAGICHSDLHSVAGDFRTPTYPIVPGHEIAGRVVAVGSRVKKFKVGDYAGVGCMVNSCGVCEACKRSEEQFCTNAKTVFTYNSKDVFHSNEITMGGYSNNIVVSEKFAITIPKNAQIEKVAPLLCVGITTYSPIKFSQVKKGQNVAVAGVGGLGHMALQYMVKLGANVTCFDRIDKEKAVKELGAKSFINVNSEEFKTIKNEFDFIISTIPYQYDINDYHGMLKLHGEMAIVGLPAKKDNPSLNANAMIWSFRRRIYSSLIGGIKETQEMLDYSIKNNIYPKVQIIPIQKLDEAYQSVAAGTADFRYVIDMKSLV